MSARRRPSRITCETSLRKWSRSFTPLPRWFKPLGRLAYAPVKGQVGFRGQHRIFAGVKLTRRGLEGYLDLPRRVESPRFRHMAPYTLRRTAMQAAAIRQREAHQQTCPACGSAHQHTHGTKRRVLLTSFGRVEVPLKRQRCQRCGQRYRHADACLAEVRGHNITPELRELASLVCSSWPYQTAAGVLQRLSGVLLSDERLRQLTNEQGSAFARQQQARAQRLLSDAISLPQIRRERAQSAPAAPPSPPQWLQVGLDGGWVPSPLRL